MATSSEAIPANAWQEAGPAQFDFRSDVMTRPTLAMLNAIQAASLADDVYQEDTTTSDLESFIAELTGHEAALYVLSGTMGNQIALRTHLKQPPHAVLCDRRSHIYNYEAGGVSSLCGAMLQAVKPSNGLYLTLEDIKPEIVLGNDVHECATRVVSLENTINGSIIPLEEVRKISEYVRSLDKDIKLHLDGARLWEVIAAGAGTLKEYAACFDSMSLCFSKGLGAPIGSIITGKKDFIQHSRWIRKSIGGGLRQAGVVTSAARVAVEDTFLGGKLTATHQRAKRIGELWVEAGGKLARPVETNMVWIDLVAANVSYNEVGELAASEGIKLFGDRIVVHYQISEEAVDRIGRVFKKMIDLGSGREAVGGNTGSRYATKEER